LISTPTYTKPMTGAVEWNRFDRKNHATILRKLESRLVADLQRVWHTCDAVLVLDQVGEPECGVVTGKMRDAIAELATASPAKFVMADSRERIDLFRAVAVKPNRQECDRAGGVAALLKATGKTVFCTEGEAGIRVATNAGETMVPGYPVSGPVDICGAGDSCSAGVACAKVVGCSDVEAAAFGNLVASITVQQIGTTGTASPGQVRDRWLRVSL
jgi:bifunctional ADP-heptose synthase (sugar kinase/adenylyltransferase)